MNVAALYRWRVILALSLSVVSWCVFPASALAEGEFEEDDLEVEDGGEVETSTRRVDGVMEGRARRVERVGNEDLRRRSVSNLAEAMAASSAGSQVSPTGTATGIIIDGLPSSQVVVLRDGLPVASLDGSRDGPLVDLASIAISPDSIERIDIYRGVGPVGSGGAGGVVIDIVSKEEQERSSISASGQLGGGFDERSSRDGVALLDQRVSAAANVALGERWSVQAGGQFSERAALDVNRDEDPDRAGTEQLGGDLGVTYRPARNALLRVRFLGNRSTTSSLGGPNAVFDDIVDRRVKRARIKGRWWANEDVRIDHHTDIGRDDHVFSKRVRASAVQRLKSDTRLDEVTQSISAMWFTASHDLAIEGSGRLWSVERSGETGDLPRLVDFRGGVGVADTWYMGDRTELFSRAFIKGATDTGGAIDAQLALSREVGDHVALRASAARTTRAPTPEELYLIFDHSEVGYIVTGNPDLLPERLYSGRLGVVWTTQEKDLGVDVSGFFNHIDRIITTAPDPTEPSSFTYANLNTGRTAGVQFGFQAHDLPAKFAFIGNYTFMPLAVELETGEPLPNRATHAGRAEIRRRFLKDRLDAWVDMTTRSQMNTPSDLPEAPAFALLGAGARYAASDSWHLTLDANNLLDQTNATWGPMPGRSVLLGVQLRAEASQPGE